jgi:serine/alanine racemase
MEGQQMNTSREYGGIDRFRLFAALLIVGIHTFPLSSVSETLNFGFVNIFSRIAVPFFLMITGYFVCGNAKPPLGFLKKTGFLYAGATLLYLPVSIYAGYYSNGNILTAAAKNIIFDGTFYHLWYLTALIIGVLLFYALSRKFSLNVIFILTIILYIFGLLGDSYHGLTSEIPFLKAVYDMGFSIFSYTRNGLFYAPVFLAMGATTAKIKKPFAKRTSLIGFIISMILMLAEGFTLRHFDFSGTTVCISLSFRVCFSCFNLCLQSKRKHHPLCAIFPCGFLFYTRFL